MNLAQNLRSPKRIRTLSLPCLEPITNYFRRPSDFDFSKIRQNNSVFDSPSEGSSDSLDQKNRHFFTEEARDQVSFAKDEITVNADTQLFAGETDAVASSEMLFFAQEEAMLAEIAAEEEAQEEAEPFPFSSTSFPNITAPQETLENSFISLESVPKSTHSVCSIFPSTSQFSVTRSFFSGRELIIKAKKANESNQKAETKKEEENREQIVDSKSPPSKSIQSSKSPSQAHPKIITKSEEGFKEILITCNYGSETKDKRKRKMFCKLPKFFLYDKADQESSQVIRMIFSIANIPYEMKEVDEITIQDLPLRSVPVLEIDGAKIGNATTICRHLGWRFDLSGQTALEDSMVDMIAETIHEAKQKLQPWLDHIEYKSIDYSKPECSDRYALEYLDGYLGPIIENILLKSGSSWLIGHKMTWADLMVASLFNSIIYHRPNFFHSYPNIYLHNKKVAELESLEGMLYCVRDRMVDVSLFRHVKPLSTTITQKTIPESQLTACT